MDLGPHAGFVWLAYGIVAAVLAGVVTWLTLTGRRRTARVAELETLGVRRRSAVRGA